MNKKPTIKNEWDEKFIRENWSFPFGSIMNAFGQICQSSNVTTAEILKFAKEAFELSQELVDLAMLKAEGDKSDYMEQVQNFVKGLETKEAREKKQADYEQRSKIEDIEQDLPIIEEK